MIIKEVRDEMSHCVRLEWESIPVDRNYDNFMKTLPSAWNDQSIGLYFFEGKHHAYPLGSVLYIGMTTKAGSARSLQSADSRFFREDPPRVMYGSYWDLVLRWTALIPEDLFPEDSKRIEKTKKLAKALESLLIVSMKPPLNAQGVDGWLDEEAWDLVVGNAGDKGLLLPMLHGHECFFTHKPFKSRTAEVSGE